MGWIRLAFDGMGADAERLSELLHEAGATAVTLSDCADEPLFEPAPGETPLWSQTRVIGLFEAGVDTDRLLGWLRTAFGQGLPQSHIEQVEDKDWEREWMDHFQPLRISDRLWICPSWLSPPDPSAVNIVLDPGLAFGTGTHPTTALCLERLNAMALRHRTVVDYGCGSGILAIAAALLGAQHVWAVDIDPQALAATRNNAKANGVLDRITANTPEALPRVQTDVLVANILARPLRGLAPQFAGLVTTGGLIVLSGILASQSAEVVDVYSPWFEMGSPVVRDEWVRLEGIRY